MADNEQIGNVILHIKVIHQTLFNIIYHRDKYQHQLNDVKVERDRLVFEMESIDAIKFAEELPTDNYQSNMALKWENDDQKDGYN